MIAAIVSTGARSALGFSSRQLAMGARSGRFTPTTVSFRDRRGQAIGMGLCGGLGERLFGYPRLKKLVTPTLIEAAMALPATHTPMLRQGVPLLLCLPEAGRPDDDLRLDDEILAELDEGVPFRIDVAKSAVVRKGYASFAFAVEQARDLLAAGESLVLVSGVDSYYHPDVLQWLDEGFRLHALGATGGFIPGEGAATLALASPQAAGAVGYIEDVATGFEESATDEDAVNEAGTMTGILAGLNERSNEPIRWAMSDYNGEPHRYREWDLASSRQLPIGVHHSKWAWINGDVGAASGAMYATLATELSRYGCVPYERGVLLLHSDGQARGAVLLGGGADA